MWTGVVLTWVVYCLAVNDDIQEAARQEVQRVCAESADIDAAAVHQMT